MTIMMNKLNSFFRYSPSIADTSNGPNNAVTRSSCSTATWSKVIASIICVALTALQFSSVVNQFSQIPKIKVQTKRADEIPWPKVHRVSNINYHTFNVLPFEISICTSELHVDQAFLLNYSPLERLIDYDDENFMSKLFQLYDTKSLSYDKKSLSYDKMTWFLDCSIDVCLELRERYPDTNIVNFDESQRYSYLFYHCSMLANS